MKECPKCYHPLPAYCRCIRILARSGQRLPPLGEYPGSWAYPDERGSRPPSIADAKKLIKHTNVWNRDLWEMLWGKDRAMNKRRGKENDGYRPMFLEPIDK